MILNGKSLLQTAPIKNMLTTKVREHGVSHGLSEAGYDIRLKQDIRFTPGRSYHYLPHMDSTGDPLETRFTRVLIEKRSVIVHDGSGSPDIRPGHFTIASAIEEFQMPDYLVGIVHDKSTWARRGLSVFNTVIEPGWKGFLTLELVYRGETELHLPAGCGIAQVVFTRTSDPMAYSGKYQNQANRPVAAIYEKG